MPKVEGESEAEYIARIKHDAKEQGKKAAERGSMIHSWIEDSFIPDLYSRMSSDAIEYALNAMEAIESHAFLDMTSGIPEKYFSCEGYGGKCDLHFISPKIVIDFKTTEKDLATIKTWDEHGMQLAAYRHGLGLDDAQCAIVYINVLTKKAKLIWIDEEELQRGMKMFNALKDFWYAKTGLTNPVRSEGVPVYAGG
jgi:hypothetical protein